MFLFSRGFCLEKHFLLSLAVFVGFPQPRRSSGRNLSLSLSALFLSLTRLFVIFPPPTNPREAMLIKTYIAEAYATILFPGKPCQQHIQWLRDGYLEEASPNALETRPTQSQPGNSSSHSCLGHQTSPGQQESLKYKAVSYFATWS